MLEQLGLRIDPKLAAKLRAATNESKQPYAPTIRKVVERGIELALKEIEGKKKPT